MIVLVRKNLSCSISKHTSFVRKSLIFFSTQTSPTIYDILLHKYHFPLELASRISSDLVILKNAEKADSLLMFLKESGFSNTQLQKIVKYRPRLITASLEVSIKPKIKVFQDLGISSDDISMLISSNPAILHLSANNNILPSLNVLNGLLGSYYNVAKLLRASSWFVTSNLEKTMVPNIEILKSFGIPMERILLLLYYYPRAFLLKPEILRRSVETAEEMGVDPSSKQFIYAIRTIAKIGKEAWELKLQAFRDLNFSENEIKTIFMRAPSSLAGSTVKIKKIKDILLATGKFSMSCIVNNPMSLACSIEKRYKPRLRILEILESKNKIRVWPSLGKLYRLTDDKFFEKFISPYVNEVSNLYITKSSVSAKMKMKVLR